MKFACRLFKFLRRYNAKNLWALLGFIMFFCYIWDRFIRVRLSREVPLDLDIPFLLCLIGICGSYVYAIFRTVKPKPLPEMMIKLLQNPIKAISHFAVSVKNNVLGEIGYKKLTLFFSKFISYEFFYFKLLLLTFYIIPHLLLLFALLLDVFYFSRIHYFYSFIWFSVLPLLFSFMLLSFNYQRNYLIQYWTRNTRSVNVTYIFGIQEPKYDYWHEDFEEDEDEDPDEPPSNMYVTFDKFIKVYCEHTVDPNMEHISYVLHTTEEWFYLFMKEQNLTFNTESVNMISNYQKKDISFILKLYIILQDYQTIMSDGRFQRILKYSRICIFLIFLGLWYYILHISVTVENITNLLLLLTNVSNYVEDPFSAAMLFAIPIHIKNKIIISEPNQQPKPTSCVTASSPINTEEQNALNMNIDRNKCNPSYSTALLLITTKIMVKELYKHDLRNHQYYIYIDDLAKIEQEIILRNYLKNYKRITVVLFFNTSSQPRKIRNIVYSFEGTKIKPINVLQNVFELNKKCIYDIINVGSYGFYIQEFAFLLPQKSVLISLFDYKTFISSSILNSFLAMLFRDKHTETAKILHVFLKTYTSTEVYPSIYVSTKHKYGQISIFNFYSFLPSEFHPKINPFYKMQSLIEIQAFLRSTYKNIPNDCSHLLFQIERNSFIYEFQRGLSLFAFNDDYIKRILCKNPTYNPSRYKDHLAITTQLNLLHKQQNNAVIHHYFNDLEDDFQFHWGDNIPKKVSYTFLASVAILKGIIHFCNSVEQQATINMSFPLVIEKAFNFKIMHFQPRFSPAKQECDYKKGLPKHVIEMLSENKRLVDINKEHKKARKLAEEDEYKKRWQRLLKKRKNIKNNR